MWFVYSFNYMDDIRTRFGICSGSYHNGLKTKDTTNSPLYILIFSLNKMTMRNDWNSQLYKKRDDFNFLIVNLPFLWINISTAPVYRAYISKLIGYSNVFVIWIARGLSLSSKHLTQGLMVLHLKSLLWTIYDITNWLIDKLCFSHSRL